MGDLRKFYSLATIIFVGRSLVPMGGSDMMEAAALGKCTIFGPHAFNFRQTVEVLLQGRGAIQVTDAAHLRGTLREVPVRSGLCQDCRTIRTTDHPAKSGGDGPDHGGRRTLLQGAHDHDAERSPSRSLS